MNFKFKLTFLLFLLFFSLFLSCKAEKETLQKKSSPQTKKKTDLRINIQEKDVTSFLTHTKKINTISTNQVKKIKSSDSKANPEVIRRGIKKAVDNYLIGQGFTPSDFYSKGNRIMKIFFSIKMKNDPDILESKRKALERSGLKKEEIEENLKIMKKTSEELYRQYTEGVTDKEKNLVEKYLPAIEKIVQGRTIKM